MLIIYSIWSPFGNFISSLENKPSTRKTDKAGPTSIFIPIRSKNSVQKSSTGIQDKSATTAKNKKNGEIDELAKMLKTTKQTNGSKKKSGISTETESGIIAALNIMNSKQADPKKIHVGVKELSGKVSLSYKKSSGMQMLLKNPNEVQPAQEYLKELNLVVS